MSKYLGTTSHFFLPSSRKDRGESSRPLTPPPRRNLFWCLFCSNRIYRFAFGSSRHDPASSLGRGFSVFRIDGLLHLNFPILPGAKKNHSVVSIPLDHNWKTQLLC